MKLVYTKEFTPTIEAKSGFNVKVVRNKDGEYKCHRVFDGRQYLFSAQVKGACEHNEELVDNECYVIFERFITTDGDMYLYAADIETGEDFIVPWSKGVAIGYEEEDE